MAINFNTSGFKTPSFNNQINFRALNISSKGPMAFSASVVPKISITSTPKQK